MLPSFFVATMLQGWVEVKQANHHPEGKISSLKGTSAAGKPPGGVKEVRTYIRLRIFRFTSSAETVSTAGHSPEVHLFDQLELEGLKMCVHRNLRCLLRKGTQFNS